MDTKDNTLIINRCAAAFAEHRSTDRAYAVVKVDAHFGLTRQAQANVRYGWIGCGFRSDLGLVHSLLPEPRPCKDMAYQNLLLICSVDNHDRDAIRAFFDSVEKFFAYRSTTPQRNGARAYEMQMYPPIIPESCDCDACFREKERRYFQARYKREAKEHPEWQGAEILRDADTDLSVWFFSGLPGTQPHFRVYNSAAAECASQSAAVSLLEPCYLPYADTSGKAPFCLPRRSRRKLMKLLQTPLPAGDLTHYEWMIRLATEARPTEFSLPSDHPLPNYLWLPSVSASAREETPGVPTTPPPLPTRCSSGKQQPASNKKITLRPIQEYAGISEENFWSWLYASIPHLAGKDEAFFLRLYGKTWLDDKWLKYKRDTFRAFCDRIYKERTPEAYDYCVISFNCRYDLATSPYYFIPYNDEDTKHTRLMFINTNRDPEFFENIQKFYETKRTPTPPCEAPLYNGTAVKLETYPSTLYTTP